MKCRFTGIQNDMLAKHTIMHESVNIFLFLSLNVSYGYSEELSSKWYGTFKCPQHDFMEK